MGFGLTSSFSRGFSAGTRPLSISGASQLPNLEVWYDAGGGTRFNKTTSITSGTPITSWQNAGGLTSHDWNQNGNASVKPTWVSPIQNNLGVVRFNPAGNTSQMLSINPIAYLQSLGAVTMVLLFRTLSTAAGRRILTSTDTSGFQWGQNGTQWVGQFAGGAFSISGVTADTSFHHVVITFDGSQTGDANRVKVRFDGTNTTLNFTTSVNATTSAAASQFYGGVDSTGTSNYWSGDLGELMIFTRALRPTEVLAIEDYLTRRWAV